MLTRTHCEIWGYDFSVVEFGKQLNASHRDRAHFKQAGISGETDLTKEPPFYSIQDLMKQNGHDYMYASDAPKIEYANMLYFFLASDILKVDIEFAEFASLESLSKAYPKEKGMSYPIGQILVELHLFQRSPMTSGQFLDWYAPHCPSLSP
jgi:hypothetical protein